MVFRSDVDGYYAHIRHGVLLKQLSRQVRDHKIIHLVRRYLHRVETAGGEYRSRYRGLPTGCPLAPLLGALYLAPLDEALAPFGAYLRFMDDWVVFTHSQRRLKKAVRIARAVLHRLGMSMHPNKTSIGPTQRGFTFLGVDFLPRLTTLCRETQTTIKTRLSLLLAQAPGRAAVYRKGLAEWVEGLRRSNGVALAAPHPDSGFRLADDRACRLRRRFGAWGRAPLRPCAAA